MCGPTPEWPSTLQVLTWPIRAFVCEPHFSEVRSVGDFFCTLIWRVLVIIFATPVTIIVLCVNFYSFCKDLYPAYKRQQRRRQVKRNYKVWSTEIADFCSRYCPGFVCPKHGTYCYPKHTPDPPKISEQTWVTKEVKCQFGGFMRLPAELRLFIYEKVIEATWESRDASDSPSSWSGIKMENHPLFFVSRQVRKESMPCFWTASRFHVRIFDEQAVTIQRNPSVTSASPMNVLAGKLTTDDLRKAAEGPRVSPWIHDPENKFRRMRHLRLEFHWQLSWADHWPVAVFDLERDQGDEFWHVARVPPSTFPWWCLETWRHAELDYEERWVEMVHGRIHEMLRGVKYGREGHLWPEDIEKMAHIQGDLVSWQGRDDAFGPDRARMMPGPRAVPW